MFIYLECNNFKRRLHFYECSYIQKVITKKEIEREKENVMSINVQDIYTYLLIVNDIIYIYVY